MRLPENPGAFSISYRKIPHFFWALSEKDHEEGGIAVARKASFYVRIVISNVKPSAI
jgi:hypothetical protein